MLELEKVDKDYLIKQLKRKRRELVVLISSLSLLIVAYAITFNPLLLTVAVLISFVMASLIKELIEIEKNIKELGG